MSTMGSATPTIISGWPPATLWMTPAMQVDASTCTTPSFPDVLSLSCWPNASAGMKDARKMYVAGASSFKRPGRSVAPAPAAFALPTLQSSP